MGRVTDELPSIVARHLTGLPNIRVLWREPPYEHSLGAVINNGGECLVYVSPGTMLSTLFFVLLHELAHAKLHFKQIPNQASHTQRAPGSITRKEAPRLGDVTQKPLEEEADILAHEWQEFADNWMWRYMGEANDAPYNARLLALLDYPKG